MSRSPKKKSPARSAKSHAAAMQRIHKWIAYLLSFIMVVGFFVAILERQWLNSILIMVIAVITFLPPILGKRFKVYIPPELEILAVLFLFSSLFLGEIRDYYIRFWWWDVVLHTGSGLLLGIVGFLLIYVLNQDERVDLHMRPGFIAFFSFVFAVAAGALWEIFEYFMDIAFGLNMQKSGLRDTMGDLIVDSLGAIIISGYGYYYLKSSEKSWVDRAIERFVHGNPRLFRSGRKTPAKRKSRQRQT